MITHETDFYTWTQEQANLLKQGRFMEADVEHLIEELESMGASERRELVNRLGVLLAHLLKWRYQPEQRGKSWRATIMEQRRRVNRVLKQNPGLKPSLEESVEDAYGDAVFIAARETDLNEDIFPSSNPWQIAQILHDDFWPG
ncbi:DUF29 domain-containing protein [Gammaproteobacteria bacterium]